MSNPVVAVTVTANTKPYTSAMDKAAASTSKLDKASQTVIANSAKQAAAYGAAAVGLAAFAGGAKSAINAAVGLQDSAAKMAVVFGDASKSIEEFADDTSKSFGLTKQAAYDATSTFAIFGKAAGLTGQELSKFSTDLTQRAVDLSSFFGGSTVDAITAVGAALRGESEPIRAYGVLLDDATLRNQALQMGLISSVKEGLTPQARALAAASEVMSQSADAAGDYVRTQDGAANSIRNFNTELGRMKEQFGTAVLPALTEAAQGFAKLLELSNQWDAATARAAGGSVPNWSDVFSMFKSGGDDAAVSAESAAQAAAKLAAEAAAAAGPVAGLGTSAAGAAGGVQTLDEAMRGAIDGLFGFIDAQQGLASSQRDMLGLEGELLDSARQTTAARTTGARKSGDAETKSQQKVIDGIRKRDAAEQESEIRAARRRAQAKAEANADRVARRDVRGGVADAIATDKAARAGQDIDGFNQGGSVGEATGSLSKGAQKALDREIESIRARFKKSTAEQIKGLGQVASGARATAAAADSYSFSLDANTEAGRRNLDTLSAQVDKVQTNAQAVYDAAILDGKGAREAGDMARDALLAGYDAITESATNVGFARREVEKYLAALGLIPKKIKTEIDLKIDTTSAEAKIKRLGGKLTAIQKAAAEDDARAEALSRSQPVKPKPYPPTTQSYPKTPRFTFATGGEITGPGTPTSDSVPIWASRGEFVVNAQQFAANRELVKAINSGSGAVAAGGGIQIGAVNVTEATASGVRMSVIDALAEAAYRNGAVR